MVAWSHGHSDIAGHMPAQPTRQIFREVWETSFTGGFDNLDSARPVYGHRFELFGRHEVISRGCRHPHGLLKRPKNCNSKSSDAFPAFPKTQPQPIAAFIPPRITSEFINAVTYPCQRGFKTEGVLAMHFDRYPATIGEFIRQGWTMRWSCTRCAVADVRKLDIEAVRDRHGSGYLVNEYLLGLHCSKCRTKIGVLPESAEDRARNAEVFGVLSQAKWDAQTPSLP
jgi:hypothetical protein